jgi:hypothetical protein
MAGGRTDGSREPYFLDEGRERAYRSLVRAVTNLGYPEEFAYVMSGELRSEGAMRRLTSYLVNARPASPEEVVDEMLAIVQSRDAWVEHQMREQSNARLTQWYNRPDRPDPEPGDADGSDEGPAAQGSSWQGGDADQDN